MSNDSSSSGSFSSSSSSSEDDLETVNLVNFTMGCREAQLQMTQHEQKVEEAKAQFDNKMRLRWNRDREYQSKHKRIQDARHEWMLAKQKPRAAAIPTVAGEAAAFANGQMVRIKTSYWKQLQVPAAAKSGSCHWRVCHFSGFSYTLSLPHSGNVLECVPPDAMEELDYELLPGSVVSIVEPPALSADVARQLHQVAQRCGSGARLKQRRSDTTFEVTFPNGATLLIPNGNLRPPNHPVAPQPRPRQPAPQKLLGFTYLDYVRDEEGRKGVVTGLCSEDPLNLKVILTSYSAHVSLPASTLTSEEVWFSQRVTELTKEAEELKEELEKSCAAAVEADAQLKALQAEQEKFVERHREAEDAKREAEGSARTLRVVKVARFKTSDRPQEWRDISSYVTVEWSVAMETAAGLRQLIPLGVFKTAAYQVVGETEADREEHIFSNQTLGTFRLSRAVAEKILKHRNIPTADPLHSFALLKAALGAGSHKVVLDVEVRDFFSGPVGLFVPKDVAPPTVLVNTLRPYQLTGFRWLVNNIRNGFGSLLADDMGLGKTLQTISLIMYLKQQNLLKPILIVVPSGLVQTWRRELEHWAKDLRVHLFYGKSRQLPSLRSFPSSAGAAGSPKRRRLNFKQAEPTVEPPVVEPSAPDVVLTSYAILRNDAELLAIPGFGGMILDEAQHIKNFNTKLSKAVKDVAEVVGHLRVALSGTPVENSLTDLHSIFDFILPGYLPSRSDFERTFGQPLKLAARKGNLCNVAEEKRSLLNRLKEPFLLRRLKTDPAISADLPDKVQQTHECELSPKQRKIYTLVQKMQWAACAGSGRNFKVLEMLQAMREVCNHPACLPEKRRPHGTGSHPATDIELSGKCAKFHELLDNILAAGEKALVFSSSLSAIDVLLQQIQRRKDRPCALKIIGNVAPEQRQALIDQFQNDPNCSLLLLSQVGTVGLNLTAATHVIHFDRQYNPAKENQATDRAHRIGQKRTVFVHFLISKDTFEERLAEILEQKQQLSDLVMFDCEKFITDMDNDELHKFFMLKS